MHVALGYFSTKIESSTQIQNLFQAACVHFYKSFKEFKLTLVQFLFLTDKVKTVWFGLVWFGFMTHEPF